jgi:2-polyprenyl-3-methyl-5-hydroxy-6-metoxy-1,4-benzoquinol methylase
MTTLAAESADTLEARARATLGTSADAIYRMVADALAARAITGGCLVDVGCGRGDLRRLLGDRFDRYCGLDAVRYDGLPPDVEFHAVDLDAADWRTGDLQGDIVVAVETIEHLENPWAFLRGLVRLTRPGGWVLVTTPNQLSAISLLTLTIKQRFAAFQDSMYPMHRTALLGVDLVRAGEAAGLERVEVRYSRRGRVPLTALHYPAWLSRAWPRALSDNVLMIGRRARA